MTNLEIEAFLAIVDYGTVSAAASHLFVTQPALSRRIKALEEEIGYSLFQRQKGGREIRLTREGEEFLPIAGKWKRLWEETSAISGRKRQPKLELISVGSVSSYIFPEVFRRFLGENPEYQLTFHQCHSREAYEYMEQKMADLAFVSDQRYAGTLKILPAFSEPFVLAGALRAGTSQFEKQDGKEVEKSGSGREQDEISAKDLDPAREVRLPWNGDYDQWHIRHFPDHVYPHVFLDQMSLMEEFLTGENWAVVPITVGYRLKEREIPIWKLKDAPPDRMIYYLVRKENENPLIGRFLYYLNQYLEPLNQVSSYLGSKVSLFLD